MGAAAIPLMAVAAGVQVAGQIRAGNAANATAKYNASLAENNATIATQNAAWASQEGTIRNEQQGLESRASEARLLTNQAASGIDIGSNSLVDVRASEYAGDMIDAATLRTKAAREAYGYQVEAVDSRNQAALTRQEGKNARTSSYINAAGTLLSAGAKMAGSGGGGGSAFSSYQATKSFLGQPKTRVSS